MRNPKAEADDRAKLGRRLPRRTQLILLAVFAGVAALAVVIGPLHPRVAPQEGAESQAAATNPDAFKPTPQQWAGLKLAAVATMTFYPAHQTEGKIAIDDDLVTPVFSPYSGRVSKLFAKTGDVIKKGDPLLAIQAVELAQGENDLITAVANLKTARAQLALAETNEKRQHSLFLAQGGALKDWQQSQVDLATAQGGLRTAEIAITAVRNRLRILGKSEQEIATIESTGNVQNLDAEATVNAPIGGTVTQRQVGLGQNIVSQSNGGSTPVFSIGDLSKVWLVANVRETDAPLIHLGDPVEVRVSALPGQVFKAKISFVAPSIDPNTHRLPVRADVENTGGALKPEMFATFRIVTGAAMISPAVPETALVYEGEDTRVWLADGKEKTLAVRQVKVGIADEEHVQILDGLKPGDTVVTSGGVFIDRAAQGD